MACNDVMVDLETLGTTADAVVLAIGAVRFDADSAEIDNSAFYRAVTIQSNLDAGRAISPATLFWWTEQSAEARAVLKDPDAVHLDVALSDFVIWGGDWRDTRVWGNGSDFDVAMLSHALREPPWKFWNIRCMRTLKNLPGMKDVRVPAVVAHNALSDAHAQAQSVQAMMARINGLVKAQHPMLKAAKS